MYVYISIDIDIYIWMYKYIYTKFSTWTHVGNTHAHTRLCTHSHISVPSLFCGCLSFSQSSTVVPRYWEQPATLGFPTCLEQSPWLFKKPRDDNGRYILVHTHTGTSTYFTSQEICPGNVETAQQAVAGAVLLEWKLSACFGLHRGSVLTSCLVYNIAACRSGLCHEVQLVLGKSTPPNLPFLYLLGRRLSIGVCIWKQPITFKRV